MVRAFHVVHPVMTSGIATVYSLFWNGYEHVKHERVLLCVGESWYSFHDDHHELSMVDWELGMTSMASSIIHLEKDPLP